jgi:uncharacterized protein
MAFLGVQADRGQVVSTRAPVGQYADGTDVNLPVVVFEGVEDGPTVFLQAGMHGDEQTGIAICRNFLAELRAADRSRFRGRLVVVPLANPPAHLARSRGWLHEERRVQDLNRVFPGDASGLLSHRIARTVLDEFILPADITIDLHSALEGCNIAPFATIDPADDQEGSLDLREGVAAAMATPFIYRKERGTKLGTQDLSGSMVTQADKLGKGVVNLEMGQSHVVTREWVGLGVTGLHNVLRMMKMMPGDVQAPPEQIGFTKIHPVHTNRGGGYEPKVAIGDAVEVGQQLSSIMDLDGQVVEEHTAPVAGHVLRIPLWGTIATGAEIAWIVN